ncbi:hypothetical protein OEA41_009104 [Lepraria neglecta]|uniref:Ankyrin n=1 Tax=Lepraria neglecta TaxID=209136 RepID=A0AAE0DHR1_9LECA|nr:hypothetical protein OEA41_009104 [Lepraria neglecta]
MISSRSSQTAVESGSTHAEIGFIEKTCGKDPLHRYLPQGFHEIHVPRDDNEVEMLDACVTGDDQKLQHLLHAVDSHSDPLFDPDLTLAYSLFATAIQQKQCKILNLLLTTYPSLKMLNIGLLRLAFENPDLDIFKLLHARSPDIINMEFELRHTSALMEACVSSDPTLPNYFLDHGADLNEGGFPGAGPLYTAVTLGQPLWLIKRMITAGARITGIVVLAAIRRQDTSILGLVVDDNPDGFDKLDMMTAQETGNESIIAMVEDAARKLDNREKKIKGGKVKAPKKHTSGKHWWQFGK